MNIQCETNKQNVPFETIRTELERRLGFPTVKCTIYDREVLAIPGTPPNVLIYVGHGLRVSTQHNVPDKWYGGTRTFKTVAAMALWIKRKTAQEWKALRATGDCYATR